MSIKASDWLALKKRINVVFETLAESGLVARGEAGNTQDDGLSDCSDRFRLLGGEDSGFYGIVFYTCQDVDRVKQSGTLPLAFWGAPDGNPDNTVRVGKSVAATFRDAGFDVEWDETPETRLSVHITTGDVEAAISNEKEIRSRRLSEKREREMNNAVNAAAELFARKNYAAYVKKLAKFETILEPSHQKKLAFARKKLKNKTD